MNHGILSVISTHAGGRIPWLLCLVWLLVPAPVHADDGGRILDSLHVGGTLGLGAAYQTGDDADGVVLESTNKLGVAIGGFSSIELHEYFALQADLVFVRKGTGLAARDAERGAIDLSYLQIPVLGRIMLPTASRIEPYAVFGPELSLLLGAQYENETGETRSIKDTTRTLDWGLVAGAGASIELSPRHGVALEARYGLGLADVHTNESGETTDIQNRAVTFMIGYRYRLGADQPRKAMPTPPPESSEPSEPQAPAATPETPEPQAPAPDRNLPAPAGSEPMP